LDNPPLPITASCRDRCFEFGATSRMLRRKSGEDLGCAADGMQHWRPCHIAWGTILMVRRRHETNVTGVSMEALGATALTAAAGRLQVIIDEAKKKRLDDYTAIFDYLRAAREAVIALDNECERLFSEARFCNFQKDAQRQELMLSIDAYLHQEHIRPRLMAAVEGLEARKRFVELDSKAWLKWPWSKQDRLVAAKDLADTLGSFIDYMGRLGPSQFNTPSGPHWKYMQSLLQLGEQVHNHQLSAEAAHEEAVRIVDEARALNQYRDRNLQVGVEELTYRLERAFL
jgi:hypothetical protein